ncbi:MAG: chorismate synthase, partial [Oscillospiraceae bacterium]|nr:chorismate synthase [Oscillospiraceae bacterium]
MKNTFGSSVSVTLFGESHGAAIGAVLDGLAPGIPVDEDYLRQKMRQRQAAGGLSTPRHEPDEVRILSGVFEGRTTGTPNTLLIENTNTKSGDYDVLRRLMRPGHADYTAYCKYHGFQDYRGGGHFSGRITAGLVAAGALAQLALRQRGIRIGSHILRCAGVADRPFDPAAPELDGLDEAMFPVLETEAAARMQQAILRAREEGDSVGGVLETAVTGLPAGVGEPWFDTVEGLLAHGLFSIGGVKGVSFGAGFDMADMRGSAANDPFRMAGERVITASNHNGGINGGITNGMPLLFRCAVKPTPSIRRQQETVDVLSGENAELSIHGRHDPAIVHRARAVVDAVTALTLCDLLA